MMMCGVKPLLSETSNVPNDLYYDMGAGLGQERGSDCWRRIG